MTGGECLNDADYQILLFDVQEDPHDNNVVQVLLPPSAELDAILGTDKWLVRQAESEALGLNAATQIDFVAPKVGTTADVSSCGVSCGDRKLEW